METLYRIEELSTVGWSLVEDRYVSLTKDQTKEVLETLIADGYNPNALRAVPERSS